MTHNQGNQPGHPEEGKFPPAQTGNASNPSPYNENETAGTNQLLDEKAEKYLRESASIEDLPDEQDQQDMDNTMQQEKEDK